MANGRRVPGASADRSRGAIAGVARWAVIVIAVGAPILAACAPEPPPDPSTPAPDPGTPLLPGAPDCVHWRYDGVSPDSLPEKWDDDYKFSSTRDGGSSASPHRMCGQIGPAVDLAWNVETGRDDVLIAVIDSGIKWHDHDAMADLGTQAHLNAGELPVPEGGNGSYDANGDGSFDIDDYAHDSRVNDRNANDMLDPEDVILSSFSDGVDSDANGYVDDISGWDFLNDDNDPLDDVDYGHGTGEAKDSTALRGGTGDTGICEGCRFLPVRVSDSFIAEGGRFAASVLFALDSGADVVQEALGAISNPPQAQQGIDAAYERGVPVVASMADEQSAHANLPAALNHTIPVNSLTEAPGILTEALATLTGRRDTLAVNGCTNTGAITWVAVPSDGCSSEATGRSAGMVGLIESAARRAGIEPHPDLARAGITVDVANVLSANEVGQILRSTADDVDFSTPNAVDPANENTDDFGQARFPTVRGWDAATGYGRVNAYEAVKAAAAGNIPPEADLVGPGEFELLPVSGQLQVRGRAAALRSTSFGYRLEWTTGLQAPAYPATDVWHQVAEGNALSGAVGGTLGTIDLAQVAAALPGAGHGTPTGANGRPDPDRFTVRIRLVVTDAEGRVGTAMRHVSVHDDPERRTVGGPAGVGASSPVFHDLDGDGADELVVATDEGRLHALRPDGSEIPGFPVSMPPAPYWHADSPTALAAGIHTPLSAVLVGAPAIADLDGDGTEELVLADADGDVMVFDAHGTTRTHMHTHPAFSRQDATNEFNRLKPGVVGGASLGDLDGDGSLEIIVAAEDRHVYAWHCDGSAVDGFPVLLVDPDKVESVDPTSDAVTFTDISGVGIGGELIATPAIGDLDGDGHPEIVVGAQEQYDENIAVFPPLGIPGESGNSRLYAISPRGNAAARADRSAAHPDSNAYLPGWPVKLPMALADVLPTIGDGVSMQAAIGDIDADGAKEVVASSASGQVMAYDADGTSNYAKWSGLPVGMSWLGAGNWGNSTDTAMTLVAFGGPAIGHLGSPRGLDVAAPTTGLGRALDTLLTNDQPGDPQLSAWWGVTGWMRPGFPRVTADLSFFVTPAIADVDSDGANDMIAGNGIQTLDAVSGVGRPAPGWPKLTGAWVVGTPGFGDWDGDGTAEVAVTRRDGVLLVWDVPTGADALGDWTRFGGNSRNDGSVG